MLRVLIEDIDDMQAQMSYVRMDMETLKNQEEMLVIKNGHRNAEHIQCISKW